MVESVVEIGVRPPPLSTARVEKPHAVTIPLERVPKEVITGVRINERARDWLSPELSYLCSEAYIRDSVVMAVPREQTEARRVLSPGYWGRAVPLGYGTIPYGEFVGGTVVGKGGFIAGKKFLTAVVKEEALYSDIGQPLSPWGFFGDKDAETEIAVGNTLLDFRFRSSLSLGYAVMESEKIRRFLLNRWQKFPLICKTIEVGLDIVKRNSDKPVFFARVCGVTERFERISATSKDEERIIKNRRKAEIARAAGLLSTEAARFPDTFSGYLEYGQLDKDKVMPVLAKLNHRNPLTDEETNILSLFLLGIGKRNASSLERLLRSEVKGPCGLYRDTNLSLNLGYSKDVDLAFITQDFEDLNEEEEVISIGGQVNDYLDAFSPRVRSFLWELD